VRPGRHSPDNPEEQLAQAKLVEGEKPPEKVVKVKLKGGFSYNGKGKQ
jgi:hypothetical protein